MTDWGEYQGRRRLPCPEDPELLRGQPIGMYHCPDCGMMVLAGMPHLPPGAPENQDPRYWLDDYEVEYGHPWPPGYEGDTPDPVTEKEAVEAVAQIERDMLEHPISSSLPEGRARALTLRIFRMLDIPDNEFEEYMKERRSWLDEAARRTEQT